MKAEILSTKQSELKSFLNSEKISLVEDALNTKLVFDTFKSYYDEAEDNNVDYKRNWINSSIELVDDNLINRRSVTTLEFAKKTNETLLAAYSPEFGLKDSNEPNGLLILHNVIKKKPELVIKHQTEITSACFHQGNPKLIVAGTFTGQILVYDVRVGPSPVLKSPSSAKQHSLPIYSINNFGPENSNQIISISNDGLVCIFNISNFSKAIKKIELKKGVESKTSGIAMEEIGVICAGNNPESDYVYVGSDDSDLYQVYLGQA